MENINQKIERTNNIKFNRTPKEKVEFADCGMTRNFIMWHKNIIKFVDWTTNTVYLKTDVQQPLYITDEDNYAKTYDDRVGFFFTT